MSALLSATLDQAVREMASLSGSSRPRDLAGEQAALVREVLGRGGGGELDETFEHGLGFASLALAELVAQAELEGERRLLAKEASRYMSSSLKPPIFLL